MEKAIEDVKGFLVCEADLRKRLKLSKKEIEEMVANGLPWVKLSSKSKGYFIEDVVFWAKTQRVNSNESGQVFS